MSDALLPKSAPADQGWRPGEMLETRPDRQDRLLGWWYALTAVPEPPASASFVKREAARRLRLFSAVNFFYLIVLLIFLPASAFMPNHLIIYMDGLLILITLSTLFLNRTGRPLLAGVVLVVSSEIVLSVVIITTMPLDEISIQLYYLFVVVDLLAVSLIPPQSIFVLAVINSVFIYCDMVYQQQTPILAHDLATQFISVLARPIGVEIIVAGVAYVWVRSSMRAIQRADRAEMIANLEHTIAEERASSELARAELEQSIEQLAQAHAESLKRQVIAKLPYPPEAKLIWPLIEVINSLWERLQRSRQAEYELYQLRQTIAAYTELLQKAALTPRQPLPLYQTKTDLDPLLLALSNLQRVLRER